MRRSTRIGRRGKFREAVKTSKVKRSAGESLAHAILCECCKN
jgi:hypothetical protein